MSVEGKAYFWRGPIQDARHAGSILNVVGWVAVAWGLLAGLALRANLTQGRVTNLVLPLVFAGLYVLLGGFLLVRRSSVAAGVLLGVTGVVALFLGIVAVDLTTRRLVGGAIFGWTLVAVALFSVAATWRALKAARANRHLKTASTRLEEVAAQFE